MYRKRRKNVNSPVPCKKRKLDLSQQSILVDSTSCTGMQEQFKRGDVDIFSDAQMQNLNFYCYDTNSRLSSPYASDPLLIDSRVIAYNPSLFNLHGADCTEHLKKVLCDCISLLQQSIDCSQDEFCPVHGSTSQPKLEEATIEHLIPKLELKAY